MKSEVSTFSDLSQRIEKMRTLEKISIPAFRKKMRPFFKTFTIGNSIIHIGLRCKVTKLSVLCQLIDVVDDLYFFQVKTQKHGEAVIFHFHVKSDKELLKKLHNHNLFTL